MHVSWAGQSARQRGRLTVAADVELLPKRHRGVHVDESRPRLWRVGGGQRDGGVEGDGRVDGGVLGTLARLADKGRTGRLCVAEQVEGVVGGVEGVEGVCRAGGGEAEEGETVI